MAAVGVIACVVVAAGLAMLMAGALAARHRAGAAADLAALSGALHAAEGQSRACSAAARTAGDNGARVLGCRLTGRVCTIRVAVPLSGVLARFGRATAASRAGPVDAAVATGTPPQSGA